MCALCACRVLVRSVMIRFVSQEKYLFFAYPSQILFYTSDQITNFHHYAWRAEESLRSRVGRCVWTRPVYWWRCARRKTGTYRTFTHTHAHAHMYTHTNLFIVLCEKSCLLFNAVLFFLLSCYSWRSRFRFAQ